MKIEIFLEKLIYFANIKTPSTKARSLQVVKSCEAFALNGLDVELVVPGRANQPRGDPFDYYGARRNFEIAELPIAGWFNWLFLPKRAVFYLKSLNFGLSAAHYARKHNVENSIFYSRDFMVLFFLCLFGLKPIAEIHDYRSRKPRWLVNYVLKNSIKIVTNSEGTLGLLLNHYSSIQRSKFLAVPNGVDLEFFNIKDTKEEARRKLDLPLGKKIIAYIGRLETVGKEKGVNVLLEAFKILNTKYQILDTFLCIVGGPNLLAEKYKTQYGKDDDGIVFTGQVAYKEIPLYLKAVDIVVVPLPRNQHAITTSPIKLFEFVAAGKAIVASDLPSLRQYLDENSVMFFEPENPEDLASKVGFLLKNPDFSVKIARQAYQDSKKYTWLSRAEKVIKFIRTYTLESGSPKT